MWGKVYKVPSLFCVMTIINVLHQKNYMCTDLLQSAIFVIVEQSTTEVNELSL